MGDQEEAVVYTAVCQACEWEGPEDDVEYLGCPRRVWFRCGSAAYQEAPVKAIDLHAQRKALSNYDYLNRFGGRYRVVCAGLYRVSRVLMVSILNDHGDIQTNRSDAELFAAVAAKHPDLQYRITALDALRPFLVRGEVEPFNPVGQGALDLVMELRQAAHDLLALAMEVREEAEAQR